MSPAGRHHAAGFGIIIPARHDSTRLPGKPLRDLAGKPLIVRVWENAQRADADFVWVATDDQRIAAVVEAVGGKAMLTGAGHASGTDRLAEVVERRSLADETIVVNVQGDEPLLDPAHVRAVGRALVEHRSAGIATLATPIVRGTELFDPNVVKVVTDASGMALTFSRAPVPWARADFAWGNVPDDGLPKDVPFLRHVGLYAYTAGTLRQLAASAPVPIEHAECLEQLRALYLGIRVHVTVVHGDLPPGIDTEDDLRRVAEIFAASGLA